MQSGIAASQELRHAFGKLTDFASRGLIVGISGEQLIPLQMIKSKSTDFFVDLESLDPLVKDNEAAYIILRRYNDAHDGFVAITFVPDVANVRQKMLFASTRLSLVRDLGAEKFRETLFVTTKGELTAEGWRRHEQHGKLAAPLTQEEQTLKDVKEAEAETSRNTAGRKALFTRDYKSPVSNNVLEALRGLSTSDYNLVQMRIDLNSESIELANTSSVKLENLAQIISSSEPRYSFFRYDHEYESQMLSSIIFISSCPSGLGVKERMLYAASRAAFLNTAGGEADLEVSKKLEISDPKELTASMIHEELHPAKEQKQGFTRPKRPGRK